jgi:hypothetical protein
MQSLGDTGLYYRRSSPRGGPCLVQVSAIRLALVEELAFLLGNSGGPCVPDGGCDSLQLPID